MSNVAKIWFASILKILLSIELIAFGILWSIFQKIVPDNIAENILGAWLMLITTFVGVFLPLQINRSLKADDLKKSNKRSLKFLLSFLLEELTCNLHVLKQIRANYKFDAIDRHIPDHKNKIDTIHKKFQSILDQNSLLAWNAYTAIQQSGEATAIDEDGYFNDILLTYHNLLLCRSACLITSQDLTLTQYMLNQKFDPISPEQSQFLTERSIDHMKKYYTELKLSIKTHENTIQSVTRKLKKLGVTQSFFERNTEPTNTLP